MISPAPWKWTDDGTAGEYGWLVDTYGNKIVGLISSGDALFVGNDAKLIAAAPKLLEACKLVRDSLEQVYTNDSLSEDEQTELQMDHALLVEAIAEATGETT